MKRACSLNANTDENSQRVPSDLKNKLFTDESIHQRNRKYITSKTCEQKGFPEELVEYTANFLQIIPPDYKLYIDLMARRRMGRIIKAGVSAAKICLNDAGAAMPEAIITGTGLGCIEDTERFLYSVLENQERLLNPAHFMQSTYNTLCSQIAIQLSCTNYNNTFVHRAFSFESALIDAMMLIAEERAGNVLVGGVDEITANHYAISGKLGIWKKETVSSLHLLESSTEGTIPGEGAAYFFLRLNLLTQVMPVWQMLPRFTNRKPRQRWLKIFRIFG